MAAYSSSPAASRTRVARGINSEHMISSNDGFEGHSDSHNRSSSSGSALFVSEDDRSPSPNAPVTQATSQRRRFPSFEVRVPPVERRETFVEYPEELVVNKVIREASTTDDQVTYEVRCGDGEDVTVSFINPLIGTDRAFASLRFTPNLLDRLLYPLFYAFQPYDLSLPVVRSSLIAHHPTLHQTLTRPLHSSHTLDYFVARTGQLP